MRTHEILDGKGCVGTLRGVKNNGDAPQFVESDDADAPLFASRGEVRRAKRMVRRIRARATRRFGVFPLRGLSGQLRGQLFAQHQFAAMTQKALLEAHIEAAANADLNTLGVFEAVLDRSGAAGAYLKVSEIRRESRGFIHDMRSAERRRYIAAMLTDPWFPAVFHRVSQELPYQRRSEAFAAACKLRDLAVKHDSYEVLSSVCANTPCRFEELWDVVVAVGVTRP